MEGFCRGCLIRYDDPMELLHYTEKYRRLFVYSTGLQVKRNDTITFLLCKDCFINMKAACKFKKQCRSSDKKLKSYLTLKDVGDGIDFCTFLKNNDDTMTFRLPLISGSSTPANQKSREDDNESTCTSIRNFMTDILQGEEMPDTEARIIREVIEEEADVLEDSLDSHWLQDDASIDTDFRLDFSFSPFATPQSVNHDHHYTPMRLSTNDQEQPKKYFTSISPARHYNTVNDYTDLIKNNQSEKELCFFDNDNTKIDDAVDMDLPIGRDNSKNEFNNLEVPTVDSGKIIDNLCVPTVVSEKSLNNLDLPIVINNEKSIKSLNLPIGDNDKSIKILNSLNIENEHLINNLDLPSIDSEKSSNTLDLPSLPSIENDMSISNLDLPIINNINHEVENMKDCYMANEGSNYNTTSKEIERLVVSKVNIKIMEQNNTCAIDKNLEKALEDKNNQEFSLEDLLCTPKNYPYASAASTPTITNILFGQNLNLHEDINENKTKLNTQDIGGLIDDLLKKDSREFYSDLKEEVGLNKKELAVNMDVDEVDTVITNLKVKKEILSTAKTEEFDIENFVCKLCTKKFKSLKALSIHFNKMHNIKIIKPPNSFNRGSLLCYICGKYLSDRKTLHIHLKKCRNKKEPQTFICDICGLEFATKSKIEIHISGHYRQLTKKNIGKFFCTICGASSTTIANFRIHQKRHTNNYTHNCSECGKGFYRPSDLSVHMRTHTGEKPFHCEHCNRYFARKDFLTKHIKLHIDDKPYTCIYCDLKFTNSSSLKTHWKSSKKCRRKRELFFETLNAGDKIDEKAISNDVVEMNPMEDEASLHEEININKELPYIDTEMSN